jgi:hypothetical protein
VEVCPELGSAARENRSFTARAADWAARQGIRQFADLGAGLPAHPSAAAAARAVTPSVRLVYVDNDPVVTSHVRALLVTGDGANHSCAAGGFPQDGRRATAENAPLAVVRGPLLGLRVGSAP